MGKIETEIAPSPEHERENIKKCLEEDQIQIVYSSEDVKRKIEHSIRNEMKKYLIRFYFLANKSKRRMKEIKV